MKSWMLPSKQYAVPPNSGITYLDEPMNISPTTLQQLPTEMQTPRPCAYQKCDTAAGMEISIGNGVKAVVDGEAKYYLVQSILVWNSTCKIYGLALRAGDTEDSAIIADKSTEHTLLDPGSIISSFKKITLCEGCRKSPHHQCVKPMYLVWKKNHRN